MPRVQLHGLYKTEALDILFTLYVLPATGLIPPSSPSHPTSSSDTADETEDGPAEEAKTEGHCADDLLSHKRVSAAVDSSRKDSSGSKHGSERSLSRKKIVSASQRKESKESKHGSEGPMSFKIRPVSQKASPAVAAFQRKDSNGSKHSLEGPLSPQSKSALQTTAPAIGASLRKDSNDSKHGSEGFWSPRIKSTSQKAPSSVAAVRRRDSSGSKHVSESPKSPRTKSLSSEAGFETTAEEEKGEHEVEMTSAETASGVEASVCVVPPSGFSGCNCNIFSSTLCCFLLSAVDSVNHPSLYFAQAC